MNEPNPSGLGSVGNIGQVSGSAPQAGQPAPAPAAVAGSLLLQRVEALISKADTILQSDSLKAKGYIEKYWPIAAGAMIAATRLFHL